MEPFYYEIIKDDNVPYSKKVWREGKFDEYGKWSVIW